MIDIITNDNDITKSFKFKYSVVPYFLLIQVIEPYWHAVAVLKINNLYFYIDPEIENIIALDSILDLKKYFLKCCYVGRISLKERDKDNGIKWAIFDPKYLGFEKLLNKKRDDIF